MNWEEITQASEREKRPAEQVFQEELQKATLVALSREKLFQKIVFQGGTALRLFYGNPRFSEDLDFVTKENVQKVDLKEHSSKIKNFTKDTFTFLEKIDLEIQKDTSDLQRLVLKTSSGAFPGKIRLHIELAYVPSYINRPRILDFSPFQPAVQVEEEKEILADKLTALLCRSYLKGRDIWDIYYLTEEREVESSPGLIGKKLQDYREGDLDLTERKEKVIKKLRERGLETLENELKRFLSTTQYAQYREKFQDIQSHVIGVIESLDPSQVKEEEGYS